MPDIDECDEHEAAHLEGWSRASGAGLVLMGKTSERMYGMGREGGGIFDFCWRITLFFFRAGADTYVYHET